MRPGKPLIFGKLKNTLILGFPGNPVSTFVSAVIFARPLIAKYLKYLHKQNTIKAILTKNLNSNDEREEYLRGKCYFKNNKYYVTPFNLQDSSLTLYLSQANSLIIRKPFDEKRNKGDKVSIIQFNDLNNNI